MEFTNFNKTGTNKTPSSFHCIEQIYVSLAFYCYINNKYNRGQCHFNRITCLTGI